MENQPNQNNGAGEAPNEPLKPQDEAESTRRERIMQLYYGPKEEQKGGKGPAQHTPKKASESKKHKAKKPSSWLRNLGSSLLQLGIIIVVVMLIKQFLVLPFFVDGHSMDDTFADRDFILIDRLTYRFHEPEQGDIIVFLPPRDSWGPLPAWRCNLKKAFLAPLGQVDDYTCFAEQHLVKRVIGVPGDVVEVRDGQVYLAPQGGQPQPLGEPYLNAENQGRTCIPQSNCRPQSSQPVAFPVVPPGHVLVMGDNRQHSGDSRAWWYETRNAEFTFVPHDKVVGKVRLRFWPLSHFGLVKHAPSPGS